MTKRNESVLQCPECDKALVNIGSKVERIHPVAKFIKNHYSWIVLGWFALIPVIIWVMAGSQGPGRLGLSYGVFSLMLVPFVVMYFLLRAFHLYRITDCPYCGFHEKQKLGRSQSGEY